MDDSQNELNPPLPLFRSKSAVNLNKLKGPLPKQEPTSKTSILPTPPPRKALQEKQAALIVLFSQLDGLKVCISLDEPELLV